MKHKLKLSTKLEIMKYTVSVLLIIIIGSLIIMSQGDSPLAAGKALLEGSVGSLSALGTTIRWTTPSIITGNRSIDCV